LEKAGLGTKRICPSCGARFYDLSKRPIECPKCRFAFEPEALLRTRRPRPDLREIAVPVSQPPPEIVEEEVIEEEELAEPLEEVEAGGESDEEVLPAVLPEAEEEEAVAVPAETRRRKRKPLVVDEDEEAPEAEGEAPDTDSEVVVEGALDEDADVGGILDEDLGGEEER
jgi:uncharacterized protein (TIGR02300 family)